MKARLTQIEGMKFEAKAEGAPAISLKRPGRRWHLSKIAFEKYWMRRWL